MWIIKKYFSTGETVANSLSPFLLALILFDLLHICYIAWNCVRNILFTLHVILMNSFVFNNYVDELNKSLKMRVVQAEFFLTFSSSSLSGLVYAARKRRYQVVTNLHSFLRHFYRQFRWLTLVANQYNKVGSPLIASGVIFHTVLNLLLIANLLFRETSLLELTTAMLVISLQVVYSVLITSSLVSQSQAFSRSDMLLYRVQQTLLRLAGSDGFAEREKLRLARRKQFWGYWETEILVKLKLATFYEILCTEHVFRYTVGPFVKLSWKAMYEFAYVYSIFVMSVTTMVRSNRL